MVRHGAHRPRARRARSAAGRCRRRSRSPGSSRCSRCCSWRIAVLGFLTAERHRLRGRGRRPARPARARPPDQVLDALEHAEREPPGGLAHRLRSACCGRGLGVVGTLEQALNATWQVQGRPGWKAKLVDLGWLVGARDRVLRLGGARRVARASCRGRRSIPTVALGLGVDIVLFVWMFRALTNVSLPWRCHLPGAIAGGVGLEVLKLVGHDLRPPGGQLVVGPLRLARRGVRHPRLAGDRRAADRVRLGVQRGAPRAARTARSRSRSRSRASRARCRSRPTGAAPWPRRRPQTSANRPDRRPGLGAVSGRARPTTPGPGPRPSGRPRLPRRCHTPCLAWALCPSTSAPPPTAARRCTPCATPWPPPRRATRWRRSRWSCRPTTSASRRAACSPRARSAGWARVAWASPRSRSPPRSAWPSCWAPPAWRPSGRRPVSTPVIAAALRRALGEDPGIFAPVAHHPATEQALVATYAELSDLSAEALSSLGRAGRRAHDVVRLCGRARAILAGRLVRRVRPRRRGGRPPSTPPTLRRWRPSSARSSSTCPQDLRRRQARLLAALAGRLPTTVVAGLTGLARRRPGRAAIARPPRRPDVRRAPAARPRLPVSAGHDPHRHHVRRRRRGAGGGAPRARRGAQRHPARAHRRAVRHGPALRPARPRAPRRGRHPPQRGGGPPAGGQRARPHGPRPAGPPRPRLPPSRRDGPAGPGRRRPRRRAHRRVGARLAGRRRRRRSHRLGHAARPRRHRARTPGRRHRGHRRRPRPARRRVRPPRGRPRPPSARARPVARRRHRRRPGPVGAVVRPGAVAPRPGRPHHRRCRRPRRLAARRGPGRREDRRRARAAGVARRRRRGPRRSTCSVARSRSSSTPTWGASGGSARGCWSRRCRSPPASTSTWSSCWAWPRGRCPPPCATTRCSPTATAATRAASCPCAATASGATTARCWRRWRPPTGRCSASRAATCGPATSGSPLAGSPTWPPPSPASGSPPT